MSDLLHAIYDWLRTFVPEHTEQVECTRNVLQEIIPDQLQLIATLVLFGLTVPFFLLGWYHLWMTFQHRNGHWTGYYLPVIGPFLNVALDGKGRRHRTKGLLFLAVAIPLMLVLVPNPLTCRAQRDAAAVAAYPIAPTGSA